MAAIGDNGMKGRFETLVAMAEEESSSRIWLGAHYRGTARAMRRMTEKIAAPNLDHFLLPEPAP